MALTTVAGKRNMRTGRNKRDAVVAPLITLFLPSLEGGGAERAFVELANRFVDLGVEVHLVLVQSKGRYLAEVAPGVRIVDLRGRRTLCATLKLCRYIRRWRPDAVVSGLDTANAANWIACWLAGLPQAAVLTQRSVLTVSWKLEHPLFARIWTRLLGVIYRRSRLVISNSASAASDLHVQVGVRHERSAVIYNSVDASAINKLAAEPVDHEWASSKIAPLLLVVASLTTNKDLPTTLRAFARLRALRDCRLVILGEGPERPRLERLICELGLHESVQLIGFDRNPFRWMARARVLVSSSPSEGCPNVILQALACGLQVVATKGVGGTSEILGDGRWGRLVPVGDDRALAHAIAETLDNPLPVDVSARTAMYDPDRTAIAYLQLLLPSWRAKKGERS